MKEGGDNSVHNIIPVSVDPFILFFISGALALGRMVDRLSKASTLPHPSPLPPYSHPPVLRAHTCTAQCSIAGKSPPF